MIKSEEYNKNLRVCNLTSKLIEGTKGALNDAEIKELVDEMLKKEFFDDFRIEVAEDCNVFNENLKFEWFGPYDEEEKEEDGEPIVTKLCYHSNTNYELASLEVLFSYYCDNISEQNCIQIGSNPIFDHNRKCVVFYELHDEDGSIYQYLIVYNPSKNQKWQYTESQKAILEMLGREM